MCFRALKIFMDVIKRENFNENEVESNQLITSYQFLIIFFKAIIPVKKVSERKPVIPTNIGRASLPDIPKDQANIEETSIRSSVSDTQVKVEFD